MGPLIPQGFINPDLNLFFAFVIGLGFGYILEQAGFGSSRKLAGLFYGYDFVVLRVFFTAAITATTGLLIFEYLGWLDFSQIYIHPTYVWSSILGGFLMGLGFITGGFCPGTSMVGAVIGKIDAMLFIVGMFIGIFLFGEFYNTFKPIYEGAFKGNLIVSDIFNISRHFFALILIVFAILAFYITQKIEDRVNQLPHETINSRPNYLTPALVILGLGTLLVILPEKPKAYWYEKPLEQSIALMQHGEHYVSVDEAAYNLINDQEKPYLFIDVRPEEEYKHFSLPDAINIPAERILEHASLRLLKNSDQKIVIFSNEEALATKVWLILTREGISNIYVLEKGLNGMVEEIFLKEFPSQTNDYQANFTRRFRTKAKNYFLSGGMLNSGVKKALPAIQLKNDNTPAKIKGGC